MPSLRITQSEFAVALGRLLLFIHQQGWDATMAEGYVKDTDDKDGDHDGPHKAGGAHYNRMGQDLNLFIGGNLIADGTHPAWVKIGTYWKGLNKLARWGGDFQSKDSNHFSFIWGGIA